MFGQVVFVFEALLTDQTHMWPLIRMFVFVPLQRAELRESLLALVAGKILQRCRGRRFAQLGAIRMGATRVRANRWQIRRQMSLIGQQIAYANRQVVRLIGEVGGLFRKC